MKERLIGAAVLAALAVWLIPWLLDGPDDPLPDESPRLELPVPSGHVGEMRTEVIDLAPRREDAPSGGSTSVAAIRSPLAATSGGTSATHADGDVAAGPAASSPSITAAAPAAESSSAPAPAAESSPPPRTAASSGEPHQSPAQARADSVGSAAAPPPAAPAQRPGTTTARAEPSAATGDWAIQLGSFGDEENARRLADRVAAYGHSPKISTYRAGGRVMYRVRIGPHATRSAAQAAASTLAAHGFVAQVVTAD